MSFFFQSPGSDDLLRELDSAADNALVGGSFFAFASRGGIEALFSCPNIQQLLDTGSYHLVVGVDAITNADALMFIAEKLRDFEGSLTAEVFYHGSSNNIFHPKVSWFKNDIGIKIIAGSGNLTLRGVGQHSDVAAPSGNWEAFSVQYLLDEESEALYTYIMDWVEEQRDAGRLVSVDDERARYKAMANGRVRFSQVIDSVAQEERSAEFETNEVLVREIPRNRPGQADVGQRALSDFFGFTETCDRRILLQYVSLENELDEALEIHLFVNQSRNYRLELRPASNIPYDIADDDGRIFLIATKFDNSSFRYTLLPVTDPNYDEVVQQLVGAVPQYGRRTMREARVTSKDLLQAWPDLPQKLLLVETQMVEP